jgi:hypothetical protein
MGLASISPEEYHLGIQHTLDQFPLDVPKSHLAVLVLPPRDVVSLPSIGMSKAAFPGKFLSLALLVPMVLLSSFFLLNARANHPGTLL